MLCLSCCWSQSRSRGIAASSLKDPSLRGSVVVCSPRRQHWKKLSVLLFSKAKFCSFHLFFFSPAVEDNCFVLRKRDFDWNLPVSEFWPQFSGAHLVILVYTHHIFINIVQMSCLRPLPERYGLTHVSECSSESGSLITLARCSAACFWGAYADGA